MTRGGSTNGATANGAAGSERRPLSRPTIFVPAPGRPDLVSVLPGSAIVAGAQEAEGQSQNVIDPDEEARVQIDYEGDRYRGGAKLRRFANRVHQAAGRQAEGYPTSARAWVKSEALIAIGEWDAERGQVGLFGAKERRLLAEWISVDEAALDNELLATGYRFETLREVERLDASGDPRDRINARFLRRHFKLDRP